MRTRISPEPASPADHPPACDRCGEQNRYTQLVGFPLNNHTYWLCSDCQLAVVTIWLAEHEPQMQRRREKARAQGG